MQMLLTILARGIAAQENQDFAETLKVVASGLTEEDVAVLGGYAAVGHFEAEIGKMDDDDAIPLPSDTEESRTQTTHHRDRINQMTREIQLAETMRSLAYLLWVTTRHGALDSVHYRASQGVMKHLVARGRRQDGVTFSISGLNTTLQNRASQPLALLN